MNLRTNRKDYVAEPGEIEDIVERFSGAMRRELDALVKSVVWFGSAVRGGFVPGKKDMRDETLFGSDIDVLILVDDLVNVLTPEVITAYRVVTERTAADISKRLHITTMPLTRFWDYSLKGDPILINMLRDGKAVFDEGCFGMAQKMLASGGIRPGREIVWIYLAKGPLSVANSYWNMRQAVMDVYWAVMDATHAALLHYDIVPDTPEHLVPLVRHHLVIKGKLDKRYLSILGEFMNLGKMLMSGELQKVRGDHYDRYRSEADRYVHAVKELIATR